MKQKFIAVKKSVREAGQGMTEYLIVVALIAISAIAVFSFFGQTMRHQVAGIAAELSGKTGGGEITNAQGTADKAATNTNDVKKMSDYKSADALK